MRTTIRLPDALLDRARRKAAREGKTLTSLIEEGLGRVLADRGSRKPRPVKAPRVSIATGGLMPGVDPEKIATEAQEQEDVGRYGAGAAAG
jgi:hypothetical protein